MTAVLDKKALMRDKRAQGIAAMGLVNREGDRFRVTTPTLRGRRASYEVWRDEAGRVRCTCLEFEEQQAEDPRYRCEHILAVKHAVLNKNSESAAKQPQAPQKLSGPQGQGATPENVVAAETPNADTQPASEKLGEAAAEAQLRAPRKAPRFVREQNEQPEVASARVEIVAVETPQRSLAEHEETEELEMTKKATAHVQKAGEEQDFITAEEFEQQTAAPVVPLSFAKTLSTLKQPVEPRLIKTREGWRDRNGNQHMVEYVEWHTVADIPDRVARRARHRPDRRDGRRHLRHHHRRRHARGRRHGERRQRERHQEGRARRLEARRHQVRHRARAVPARVRSHRARGRGPAARRVPERPARQVDGRPRHAEAARHDPRARARGGR